MLSFLVAMAVAAPFPIEKEEALLPLGVEDFKSHGPVRFASGRWELEQPPVDTDAGFSQAGLFWKGTLRGDFVAEAVIDLKRCRFRSAEGFSPDETSISLGLEVGDGPHPEVGRFPRGIDVAYTPNPNAYRGGLAASSASGAGLVVKPSHRTLLLRLRRRGDRVVAEAAVGGGKAEALGFFEFSDFPDTKGQPVGALRLRVHLPNADRPRGRDLYAVKSLTVRR